MQSLLTYQLRVQGKNKKSINLPKPTEIARQFKLKPIRLAISGWTYIETEIFGSEFDLAFENWVDR